MGLFINKNKHPDVFMNKNELNESNQGYYKYDYFSEMISEQKKINKSLHQSFHGLTSLIHQHERKNHYHLDGMDKKLEALKESNKKRESFEDQAMMRLKVLDEKDIELKHILENEGLVKQELVDHINQVSESNQYILQQLTEHETSAEQLINQIKELQKQITEQTSKQDEHQIEVLNKLENQEALIQKTLRQITHFRSLLYERSSYLAEKIENTFNLTSSYIYKILTGIEQPVTLLMMNQQHKEKQKKSTE